MHSPPLVETESLVVSAVVYSELAHVTRRAAVKLPAGPARVWLKGLPASIDPARVRVRASHGRVRAVESDEIERPLSAAAEAQAQGSVEELERRSFVLEGEREGLLYELGLIEALSPESPGQAPNSPLRPDVFVAGLELLLTRRRQTVAKLRALEAEIDVTMIALAAAKAKRADDGRSTDRVIRQAALLVAIDCDSAGGCVLDVTYGVGWATWRPFYQLRLDKASAKLELVQLADVWQETSEAWDNIDLSLSTAEPESGLAIPEVRPWRLERAQRFEDKARDLYKKRAVAPPASRSQNAPPAPPAPSMARAPAPKSAPMRASLVPPGAISGGMDTDGSIFARARGAFGGGAVGRVEDSGEADEAYDEEVSLRVEDEWGDRTDDVSLEPQAPREEPPAEPEPEPEHPDLARLRRDALPRDACGGIDFELSVPGKTTARSSRQHHRLALGSIVYPARIEYLLRPVVKDHAFGRVTLTHSQGTPLLAGPGSVFAKDAYLGTTRIETTPLGGKLVLDLGAETAIKCVRRSRTSMKTAGLINKDDIHLVEVEIEIESSLDGPAELEIQDQVPISTDPKVKVKLVRTSPKDARLDEQTGIITFHAKLAPGGRLEIGLSYEIEVPKDYRLSMGLGARP